VNGIKPPAARQRKEAETFAMAFFKRLSLFQAALRHVLTKKERQGAILKLVHWLPLFFVASSLKRLDLKCGNGALERSEQALTPHGPFGAPLSKFRERWCSFLVGGEKKRAPFRLGPREETPLSLAIRFRTPLCGKRKHTIQRGNCQENIVAQDASGCPNNVT
jgi:hypothetical protein